MHLEVLVEEVSAKKALDLLLPKILGGPHTFVVHDFQGKADLLGSLAVRVRGYAARFKGDGGGRGGDSEATITPRGADAPA